MISIEQLVSKIEALELRIKKLETNYVSQQEYEHVLTELDRSFKKIGRVSNDLDNAKQTLQDEIYYAKSDLQSDIRNVERQIERY